MLSRCVQRLNRIRLDHLIGKEILSGFCPAMTSTTSSIPHSHKDQIYPWNTLPRLFTTTPPLSSDTPAPSSSPASTTTEAAPTSTTPKPKKKKKKIVYDEPIYAYTTSVDPVPVPPTTPTTPATAPSAPPDSVAVDPHGGYERAPPQDPSNELTIYITDRDGQKHTVKCKVGDNLLVLCRVLQERRPSLFLEGACELSLACSTCHVIFDQDDIYDMLPPATEKEEDMLDQAACLTSTSRLGCQIFLTKEMDNMSITLPKFSRNFYVDGHVPQPH